MGKTTQAWALYNKLTAMHSLGQLSKYTGGIHIVSASTIDPVVDEIRTLLFGGLMPKMSDNAQVALYLAYHLQIVDKYVRPLLTNNSVVIMDRTAYSNSVYNFSRPLLDPRLQKFYLEMIGPIPDLLIYMRPQDEYILTFFARSSERAKQRGKVWHTDVADYNEQIMRYDEMIGKCGNPCIFELSLKDTTTVAQVHSRVILPVSGLLGLSERRGYGMACYHGYLDGQGCPECAAEQKEEEEEVP